LHGAIRGRPRFVGYTVEELIVDQDQVKGAAKDIGGKMPPLSRWLSFVPGKSTLLLLFQAATRRVSVQAEDAASLPKERLVTATEELNQIADDVRDAQAASEPSFTAASSTDINSSGPEGPIRAPITRSASRKS
jgi:hypothetical protein